MPIEIRELVIRATVEAPAGKQAPAAKKKPDAGGVVAECVEQVLAILRERGER